MSTSCSRSWSAATRSTARRWTSCSTRRPRTGSRAGAGRASTSTCTTSARTSRGACRPGRTARGKDGMVSGRAQPPRRFRLAYLVTAWTQRPEDEHRLLSSLLVCMLRNPMLKPGDLGGSLDAADLPVYIEVGPARDAGPLARGHLVRARRRAQAVAGRRGDGAGRHQPERLLRPAGPRPGPRSGCRAPAARPRSPRGRRMRAGDLPEPVAAARGDRPRPGDKGEQQGGVTLRVRGTARR